MPNVIKTVLLSAFVWAAPALLFGLAGRGANSWYKFGLNRPGGRGGNPQVMENTSLAETSCFKAEREGFEPSRRQEADGMPCPSVERWNPFQSRLEGRAPASWRPPTGGSDAIPL